MWKSNYLFLALVLSFALVSIWGTPYLYDRGNSGRYLLKVIQTADPELFPHDSVVESLRKFDSLFYDLLAKAVSTTNARPDQIEPLMQILYIVYKFALFLGLFVLARQISNNNLLFLILLGAWAAHQKGVPVGGITLFSPQLIHTSIAFFLGLLALDALFKKRRFMFWGLSGLAVLVHAIVGLQLVLVVIPIYLWHRRRFEWADVLGFILFAGIVSIFVLFMAPPTFSPQETVIFIETKGAMYHISPLAQSLLNWGRAVSVIGLALTGYFVFLRDNDSARMLAWFVLWGASAAVIIGSLAVTLQYVRLAQFQPMRIYFWVWFFAHLLVILATIQAFNQRSPARFFLLGYLLLTIVESLWALPFVFLALTFLIIGNNVANRRPTQLAQLDLVARWTIGLMFVAIVSGWLVGSFLDFQIESLRNITPPILLAVLTLLTFRFPTRGNPQYFLIVLMITISLFGASAYRHEYYAKRQDPDWRVTQRWIRTNTKKADRFITTPNLGGNFRTLSFRTAFGEPMSALCWVDPLECRRNGERVAEVSKANQDGVWHLDLLTNLARDWNAQYILLAGTYNAKMKPVFQSGNYSIFYIP